MSSDNNEEDSWQFLSEEESQLAEAILAKLLAAVESGQNLDEVLGSAALPEPIKRKLRRKITQVLQEKEARKQQQMASAPPQQVAERSTGGIAKLFSMAMVVSVISKQALEKIQMAFTKNPQMANQVKEQGVKLLMNGVSPDFDFKPGQSISAPTVSVSKEQQQQR